MGSRGDAAMVDWDSKERGVQLGDGSPTRGLSLHCQQCQHFVHWEWARVFQFATPDAYGRDFARRLRCLNCGARKGGIMAWAETRHRHNR